MRPLPVQTPTSPVMQKFITILAKGGLKLCNGNPPKSPEEFASTLRRRASNAGMNGTLFLKHPEEQIAINRLFGIKVGDPKDVEKLRKIAIVKDPKTSPEEKREALESFGLDFFELADAFGSGKCHWPLVYKEMHRLANNTSTEPRVRDLEATTNNEVVGRALLRKLSP